MSLVCSLSGVPPEDPVYCRVSGHVYERRLIEKHLRGSNNDPITGEPLAAEDLLPVHVNKAAKPRPVTASSIPGLLSLFQNEWDATMAETYTLRSHLDTVRSQLSHSLYQHDAACRVIARLVRERDGARSQVAALQQQLVATGGAGAGEMGISDDLMSQMTTLAKQLLSGRKKRVHPNLLPLDRLKTFRNAGSFPLHSSTSPGVCCVDVDQKEGSNLVASGGVDAAVAMFDVKQQKTVSKLLGHMKKINRVAIHPTMHAVASASDDKTVRIWTGTDEANPKCAHVIRASAAEVLDVSIHPLGSLVAACSRDRSWGMYDLESGRTLKAVRDLNSDYRSLQFHPDGLILGGGSSAGVVHIWDVKGPEVRASLEGHQGAISRLAFSENGFYLATAGVDGTIRLWDLRKAMSFQTLTLDENGPANSVAFDRSGNYLAASSNSLKLFNFESRANAVVAAELESHEAAVTDMCFGANAEFLISASMDRSVRLWTPTDA